MANNSDGDILYPPDGWAEATLDDIAFWGSGGTPSRRQPNYFYGAIPWLKTGELGDKYVYDSEEKISQEAVDNSSAKIFPKGSVAIAMYGATVGKTSILGVDAATNQACAVAQVNASYISNEFLYYFLLSIRGGLVKAGKGGAQPNISQGILKGWNILVPPTNEQYRIVAKIEELFSEIDKGVEYLKTAQEQLKVYRQSVLKAAFEGKLTEGWREAHADQLETADQLLERIQQERENLYQQQLNEWEEAVKVWEENGKQVKKPQRPQQLKHIPEFPEERLFMLPPLPEGWTWASSGNLFQFVTSGSRGWAKYYSSEGAIFIRITNLNLDSLELDLAPEKIQYVQPPSDQEGMRTYVEEGDFLFSITGYLGMFAIAPALEEAYVNQHIALARPLHSFNKKFIGYYITSRTGGFHYLNQLTRGVVKAGLTLGDIVSFPVPLCSVKEQEKIVNLVEMRLLRVYELDQKIKAELQQAEVLRQSILKKAFSGRLVAQDPNDEPAIILLERIRAERLAAPKPTRKLSTSKKKPRKKEVVDLISVLQSAKDWLSAQDAFRECGVSDGAETEVIEKLFLELRDLEKEDRIEVERRGDEDWLRIRPN